MLHRTPLELDALAGLVRYVHCARGEACLEALGLEGDADGVTPVAGL